VSASFRASVMNNEQQHQGFAGLTVNGKSGGDCRGLIAWVSNKDCWAGLQREREGDGDFRKKKEKKKRVK
jgi:hypothetical protein